LSRSAPWRTTVNGIVVTCRLTAKGGRDSIDGVSELSDGTGVLLARVRAPPEDGRANQALCLLIAETLETPVSRVGLATGARSRVKQIAVGGDPEALIARLKRL
jgi:uncharacterized protein YggU (UPF0235/DUF167 family)